MTAASPLTEAGNKYLIVGRKLAPGGILLSGEKAAKEMPGKL